LGIDYIPAFHEYWREITIFDKIKKPLPLVGQQEKAITTTTTTSTEAKQEKKTARASRETKASNVTKPAEQKVATSKL
jgi:hypothetical protein